MSLRIAHLSDLHVGHSHEDLRGTKLLVDRLMHEDLQDTHVIVSGDVTHRGSARELADFYTTFEPLVKAARVTIVPGNHDRLGGDAWRHLTFPGGIRVNETNEARIISLDSTAPHNESLFTPYGAVGQEMLDAVERALRPHCHKPQIVVMHHHPLPLPEDSFHERLVNWLGWVKDDAVSTGRHLLERLLGGCDLVLHGHRHTPTNISFGDSVLGLSARPLRVFNAGASARLQRFRLFSFSAGSTTPVDEWIDVRSPAQTVAARAA